MPLVPINGAQLDVVEAGSGDPLVLVHGSWDDFEVWSQVQDRFADSFHVVSYSRAGHSQSTAQPGSGSRRSDEDDLAALIESLGISPANVAANSFGGSITLGLATRRPDLFRSIAVHEPPLLSLAADDPVVREVGARVEPVLELIARGDDEAAAKLFIDEIAIGPGAWELMPPEDRARTATNAPTFADEMADPNWHVIDLDALGRLDVPVLLTNGEESPPFFAVIIDRLEEAIPGAQAEIIPGAGHVPHETHPAEYVAAVSAFVRDSAAA
jgi:pimeloyl-ACP methyl ester carboxylesterase